MGDTLAAKAARLRSVFMAGSNCEVPTVSTPQLGQGSPRGGGETPPGDNAATINWRTRQTNVQTLLGTVTADNVAYAQDWVDKVPAQRYSGTA